VALRGELDVGTTPALREWLSRSSEGGRKSLVVDLTHVDFMAVSGLYVLCDEQARMAQHRARLTVVCHSARILQLFEVCRLENILHVVKQRHEVPADTGAWEAEDQARAERLVSWLERYTSGASTP
jgi:anti-sigma B factor antagonist